MRLKTTLKVLASDDTEEKDVQFSRTDDSLTGVISTHDLEQSGKFELAASESGYTLPMGKVLTGEFLYIELDAAGEVDVKFEGEAVGHRMKANASGLQAKLAFYHEFTTAPILDNALAAVVMGHYMIAGAKV